MTGPLLPAFRPRRVMGEMERCLLVWVSATSFQTLLDNGGDGLLSPCLGLYHLLSGLRRIMREMDAVSLSGSILPAFRPCWISVEMDAVSLSGPLLPAFRPLQDNGGDGCYINSNRNRCSICRHNVVRDSVQINNRVLQLEQSSKNLTLGDLFSVG